MTPTGDSVPPRLRSVDGTVAPAATTPACSGTFCAPDVEKTISPGDSEVTIEIFKEGDLPNWLCVFPDQQSEFATVTASGKRSLLYTLKGASYGTDDFGYELASCPNDDSSAYTYDTGTVTVTIPRPELPALSQTYAYPGQGKTIDVGVGNPAAGAGRFQLVVTKQPRIGSAVVTGTGAAARVRLVTPVGGATGPADFEVGLLKSDSATPVSVATVPVTLQPVVATPNTIILPPQGSVRWDLISDDIIPDGDRDAVWQEIEVQPKHGKVVLVGGESYEVEYTPDADFPGRDTFTYRLRARDGDARGGEVASAEVTVLRPTAGGGALHLAAGQQSGTVTIGDKDSDIPPGACLQTADPQPKLGRVTAGPGEREFTYTLNGAYAGEDTFGYAWTNCYATTYATGTVVVSIDAPTAVADTWTVYLGHKNVLDLRANDIGAQRFSVGGLTRTTLGRVVPVGEGSAAFEYVPNEGVTSGTDSFTYRLYDSAGNPVTEPTPVTVTIGAVRTVDDDGYLLLGGDTVLVDVTANDAAPGNRHDLWLQIEQDGTYGHAAVAERGNHGDSPITYTAGPRFTRDDTVTYGLYSRVDGARGELLATGILRIHRVIPVDHPLELGPEAEVGSVDLGTDVNVPPRACLVAASPDPAFATVTFKGRSLVYTLKGAYVGEDVAGYSWTDCAGNVYATGLVRVRIAKPTAEPDSWTIYSGQTDRRDLRANDKGGQRFRVGNLTTPSHGSVTLVRGSSSVVEYVPTPGDDATGDRFEYDLLDANGKPVSHAAVTITILPVALAPDTVHLAPSKDPRAPVPGPVTYPVLTNDTLPGDHTDVVVTVTDGTRGTASVGRDLQVTYTPTAPLTADDHFTYSVYARARSELGVVVDGRGSLLGTATVTIRRTVAADHTYASPYGLPVEVDVRAGAIGLDDTLVVKVPSGPVTGGAVGPPLPNGRVVYTPADTFVGAGGFDYALLQGTRVVDTGHVRVDVPQRPVVATIEGLLTDPSVKLPVHVLDRARFAAGLVPKATSDPAGGSVSRVGGDLVYLPDDGFVGPDTFTYTLQTSDGLHSFGTGTVRLRVRPPVPVEHRMTVYAGERATIDVRSTDKFAAHFTLAAPATARNGTVAVTPDGKLRYTAKRTVAGTTDSFGYDLLDRTGNPVAHGTVDVTIVPVVAVLHSTWTSPGRSVTVDLVPRTLASRGVDVGIVTGPARGTATVDSARRSVTYTAPAASFRRATVRFALYGLVDGVRTELSRADLVVVEERAVDDATVRTPAGTPVTLRLKANDVDPLGLRLAADTAGLSGTLRAGSGGALLYTPRAGFTGTETFTYVLTDGSRRTPPATARVLVTTGSGEGPTPTDPTPKDPTPKDPTPKDPTPKDPTPKDPTPKAPAPPLTVDSPQASEPDNPLTIRGTGCPSGRQVGVTLGEQTPVTATAAADGSFRVDLPAPSTLGRYRVTVTCGSATKVLNLDVTSTVSAGLVGAPAAGAAAAVVAGAFLFFLLTGLGTSSGRRSS